MAPAEPADAAKPSVASAGSTPVETTISSPKSLCKVEESESWGELRRFLFRVLVSENTEHILGLVIVLNLIMIILETDLQAEVGPPGEGVSERVPLVINLVNKGLLTFYCLELASRLYVLRISFFYDGWCILDFLIVNFDVVLLIVDLIIGDMPKVSMIRMIRLIRITRAFKALRMFPELDFLLSGFVRAFKAIVWGVIMLLTVIVIWAVLAVQLIHPVNRRVDELGTYEGCDRCAHAFESVWNAVKTFSQQLVAGDSWGQVSLPIIDLEPWTYFFFLSVLVTVSLAIINLILAVIVDSGQQARLDAMKARENSESKKVDVAALILKNICLEIDRDSSGSITAEEMMTGFDEMADFQEAMKVMGLGKEQLEMIFKALDKDGSGDVNYDEFISEMQSVKGTDTHEMMTFVKFLLADMNRTVHLQLAELSERIQMLSGNLPLEEAKSQRLEQVEIEWNPLPADEPKSEHAAVQAAARVQADEIAELRLAKVEFASSIRDLALRTEAHTRTLSKLDHNLSAALSSRPFQSQLGQDIAPSAAFASKAPRPKLDAQPREGLGRPSQPLNPAMASQPLVSRSKSPGPSPALSPRSVLSSRGSAPGPAPSSKQGPRLGPGPDAQGVHVPGPHALIDAGATAQVRAALLRVRPLQPSGAGGSGCAVESDARVMYLSTADAV